jgi:hypothetical protein
MRNFRVDAALYDGVVEVADDTELRVERRHEHHPGCSNVEMRQLELDFVPARCQPRRFELDVEIAFAVADRLDRAIAVGCAHPRTGNLVVSRRFRNATRLRQPGSDLFAGRKPSSCSTRPHNFSFSGVPYPM